MLISHQQIFLIFLFGVLAGFLFACLFNRSTDFNDSSAKCQCFREVDLPNPMINLENDGGVVQPIKSPESTIGTMRREGNTVVKGQNGGNDDWHDPMEFAAAAKNNTGILEGNNAMNNFHRENMNGAHNNGLFNCLSQFLKNK